MTDRRTLERLGLVTGSAAVGVLFPLAGILLAAVAGLVLGVLVFRIVRDGTSVNP